MVRSVGRAIVAGDMVLEYRWMYRCKVETARRWMDASWSASHSGDSSNLSSECGRNRTMHALLLAGNGTLAAHSMHALVPA